MTTPKDDKPTTKAPTATAADATEDGFYDVGAGAEVNEGVATELDNEGGK